MALRLRCNVRNSKREGKCVKGIRTVFQNVYLKTAATAVVRLYIVNQVDKFDSVKNYMYFFNIYVLSVVNKRSNP